MIEDRDRKGDELVMKNIREVQETKQLLLEAAASEEAEEAKVKKSFLSRLFSK